LLVDAHAHLNDPILSDFVTKIPFPEINIAIVTNSVDSESSIRNIELGKTSSKIIPFVGIHPEIFRRQDLVGMNPNLDEMVAKVGSLSSASSGIGEIGIDPKYGNVERQERLFLSMLSLAERTKLPVSIHSRDSVSRITESLTTFNLKSSILFHWFAGTEQELVQLRDKGIFVSFGPVILFSKRMGKLVEGCESDLMLSETDAPTPFASLTRESSTPFLIASPVFKLCYIKKMPFVEMENVLFENTCKYLGTQTSLRVKGK